MKDCEGVWLLHSRGPTAATASVVGAVGKVPVIGTPIGPTGIYTTVWFGDSPSPSAPRWLRAGCTSRSTGPDDLHRVGDTLRLNLALGALLPLDFDLGVLPLQFLCCRQLA